MGSEVVEKLRINRAYYLALCGIGLAVLLVCILVFGAKWTDAADVGAVVGLFTSLIGTLVGAFFGLQIGAAGKEDAENRAEKAQQKLVAYSQMSDPEVAAKARQIDPDLWK